MADQKVAVVTGSSSGIRYETSLLLAWNGFHTYATMRNLKKSTITEEIANKERLPLYTVQLNVTDDVSLKNAIDKILIESRRIDTGHNYRVKFDSHPFHEGLNPSYSLMALSVEIPVVEIESEA